MNLDNIKKLLKVRLHTSLAMKITLLVIIVLYIIGDIFTLISAATGSSTGIIPIGSGFYILCIVAIILTVCLIASDSEVVHYDVFPQTAFTRFITNRLLYYTIFAALIIFILLEHSLIYGILYIICKYNSNVFIGYDFSLSYELLQAFGFFMSFAIILEIVSILITLTKKSIFISFGIVVSISAITYSALCGNKLCSKFTDFLSLYFAGEYAIIHIIKMLLILVVLSVTSYYLYKRIESKNNERIRYIMYVITPLLSISFIIALICFADYSNDVFEKGKVEKEKCKTPIEHSLDISDIDITKANLIFEGFDNLNDYSNDSDQFYSFGVELSYYIDELDNVSSDVYSDDFVTYTIGNYSEPKEDIINDFRYILNKSEHNELTLLYVPGYSVSDGIVLSDYYNDKISIRKDGNNVFISREGCDNPSIVAIDSWPEFFKDRSFDNLSLGRYIFSSYNTSSGNRGNFYISIR